MKQLLSPKHGQNMKKNNLSTSKSSSPQLKSTSTSPAGRGVGRMISCNKKITSAATTSSRDNDIATSLPYWASFIIRETQAVSLWSCCSFLLRILIVILIALNQEASTVSSSSSLMSQTRLSNETSRLPAMLSTLAGSVFALLPSKVLSTSQYPGFIFSNPLILLWVQHRTMVLPNIPIRTCEYVMGRITLKELVLLLPTHFITLYSTAFFVNSVVPEWLSAPALEPFVYDVEGELLAGFVRQVAVTTAFVVGVLVVPVMLRLNCSPQWLLAVVLYPLLTISTDKHCMGESFAPNVILTFDVLRNQESTVTHLTLFAGSIIGGMMGGKVMAAYFPDERRSTNIHR